MKMNTILIIILFFLMMYIDKKRGIKLFFSLILNFLILMIVFFLIAIGLNPIVCSLIGCFIISYVILYYVNKKNIKTVSSLKSIVIVLLILAFLIFIITYMSRIAGFGYESYEESEDDIKKYRISLDVIEEEFAFYMIYLHKLNNAIESGHNELIWPRQRLLYMLDDIQFNLTNPNNFDKWYEWACCYDADKDTYESLGWEAGYFIQDVFEGEDYKSQEKLIFASTYYQLTKDPELKEVLEQYSDDDRYSEYSSIILGDTKGFTKRKK